MALTEGQITKEFSKQARAIGLTIDCLSSGNPGSEIAIISEAPGETEARMKMPFTGGAGKVLWDMLRKINIARKDVYVTNVCKRQVALSTQTDARDPIKRSELDHWEGLLEWELDQLPNLKYILVLGNFALQATLGDTGITNWRGSVCKAKVGRDQREVTCIITYNPAMVLRDIHLETIFLFDIHKMRMVLDGKYKTHPIKHNINPTTNEALSYIKQLREEQKPIAFDIEVMANETACIGFANDPHEGMCINFRDQKENVYSLRDERLIRKACQKLFLDPTTRLVAQNGNFDSYWLWYKDRIRVAPIYFDTLLAHHTLYPLMPHNLGFLTSQYTTHPYYKDDGKTWREGGNVNQFWEYNVKDCCITLAVYQKLLKELEQQKMEEFFFSHVMKLQPELVKMTVGGVLADVGLKDKIARELEEELDIKLREFQRLAKIAAGDEDFTINPKSPKQLSELFFKRIGLVGRGTSTGKQNRDRMRDHPRTSPEAVAMLNKLDEFTKEQKFYSTYATSQIDRDKRIRCEYKQFGVASAPGRLSSAKVMWGSGMNLQNQPQRAYPMFIADPGYRFTYFDLRQAEAKVVAYLWNVRRLIENFERAEQDDTGNTDVHRLNAASIFQCEYDEIPVKDRTDDGEPTKRFLGKRCVHGLNYRMMAPKLADVCNIPLPQAEEAFHSYHRAFPEIQRAWRETIEEAKQERRLYTPLGRRMIFMGRLTDDMFDSVIAFRPQSTIGDKVASVIYLCHNHPDWPHEYARMSLNIHDALIALHKDDPSINETVVGIMKEQAESPIPIRGQQVSILTDFKQSVPDDEGIHRWSTLKDI